ncbi:hypothetical protein T484DRAFT_1980632 [Baffinella frigidus]|nr:hypothetical protein T484DRAFT_1980632 [Cryptophyta sp. CCMP2293]|mmetsp:Transcript_33936/g.79312  ORF Transcript_33936/g.79312 Transcript_33936/m.79312 type:complete len:265 (+) Transcript_33936:31-825(+)
MARAGGSVSLEADERASSDGAAGKIGGVVQSLKARSRFSRSWSSQASTQPSLEADESEDGAAGKRGGLIQSLKALTLFTKSCPPAASTPRFSQRTAATRAVSLEGSASPTRSFEGSASPTRPVSFESFPGSKNPRELRNLVRARSSAVLERVHTMREQKQVDASTRNVQNALRTKSAAQRSAPSSPAKTSHTEFVDVRVPLSARRTVIMGYERIQFPMGDYEEVAQTVVDRMRAEQQEKESSLMIEVMRNRTPINSPMRRFTRA